MGIKGARETHTPFPLRTRPPSLHFTINLPFRQHRSAKSPKYFDSRVPRNRFRGVFVLDICVPAEAQFAGSGADGGRHEEPAAFQADPLGGRGSGGIHSFGYNCTALLSLSLPRFSGPVCCLALGPVTPDAYSFPAVETGAIRSRGFRWVELLAAVFTYHGWPSIRPTADSRPWCNPQGAS